MVYDESDGTVCICEGGVWVYLSDAAQKVDEEHGGIEPETMMAWARENLSGYNDYLLDAICDFAAKEIARIYEENHS